jgi:hypothetical protein
LPKTVVFDRFQDVVFPHLCAGCLIPIPLTEMWITTGKGAGFDLLTDRDKVTAVIVPVCEKCIESLSPEEKKQLEAEEELGDFFIPSVKNSILSCRVKANMVHLSLEQDTIVAALLAKNEDIVIEEDQASGDVVIEEDQASGDVVIEEDQASGDIVIEEDQASGDVVIEEDQASGDDKQKKNEITPGSCNRCGHPDFEYDSYFKEYSCKSCGQVAEGR